MEMSCLTLWPLYLWDRTLGRYWGFRTGLHVIASKEMRSLCYPAPNQTACLLSYAGFPQNISSFKYFNIRFRSIKKIPVKLYYDSSSTGEVNLLLQT
jgi:hypothetical protein